MSWRTVKQFADAVTPEELFTGQWRNLPSVLDDFKPYLDDRWSEGCTNAWKRCPYSDTTFSTAARGHTPAVCCSPVLALARHARTKVRGSRKPSMSCVPNWRLGDRRRPPVSAASP